MDIVDRKNASEILQVSVRTIDRYIKKGELNKKLIDGRIFIPLSDVNQLAEDKNKQRDYIKQSDNIAIHHQKGITTAEVMEEDYDDDRGRGNLSQKYRNLKPRSHLIEDGNEEIYRDLYDKIQDELKSKQKHLDAANYRIGQLEGILKESVPMLEYKKKLADEESKRNEIKAMLDQIEEDNTRLNGTITSKQTEMEQLEKVLKTERFNKKVFIILLIIVFLLQPFWLIIQPS